MTDRTFGRRWSLASLPYATLRLVGQATEFAGWVVFARALEPGRFGELSVTFLICRYIGLVADWGAIIRGPRDAAENTPDHMHDLVRHRNRMTMGLTALAAIILLVSGHTSLVPVTVVIINLGLARDWIALGREKGGRSGLPQFIQGTVVLACALVSSRSIGQAAVAIAVGYGAATVLSIFLNRLPPRVPSSKPRVPEAWILIAYLAFQALSSLDIILLAILRNSTDAGVYAAVYRIPNGVLAVISAAVGTLLPIATEAAKSGAAAFSEIRRKTMLASSGVAILILVASPVAGIIVPYLFGDAYRPGRAAVVVLMVAMAVIAWSFPLHSFILARGKDRRYAVIACSGAALNLVANLILIPLAGLVGAAVSTLIAQVLVAGWLWAEVCSD